jgi:hypothetical protein
MNQETEQRNTRFRRFLSAYLNRDTPGWEPGSDISEDTKWRNYLLGEKRAYLNPTRNCIQTLAARIAAQKIAPTFLTSISNPQAWSLQQKARLMEKAVQGEWYAGKLYRKSVKSFMDAAIFGLGVMAVYEVDGEVCFERVFPGQLVIPERDYLTSETPRTLYQVAYVSAEVLCARYPKYKDEIQRQIGNFSAPGTQDPAVELVTDIVQVVEAWHLRSSKSSGDGMHVCCIDGATLLSEEYKRDHYPFAFLSWNEPILGFYGQGAMDVEEPLQQELNKLLRRIQDAMQLFAVAKFVVKKGSLGSPDKVRNITGDILEYEGTTAPTVNMPASVSSEVFRFVDTLRQWIFESEGVSQMSATSQKPAGVEAAVALRYLGEMETGRHALLSTAWENFHCDLATLTVETCRAMGGTHRSQYIKGKYFEEIRWADLKDVSYVLQVFPTSYLPITPAGRLQMVEELLRAGFIEDPAEARRLLSFPDLEHSTSLATAALDDIDRQIDLMLDGDTDQHPEAYQVIQQGSIDRVSAALFRAKQYSYPKDRLDALQDWITEAQDLLEVEVERRQQQVVAMQMAAEAPPGGEMPEPIPGPQADIALATPPEPLQ